MQRPKQLKFPDPLKHFAKEHPGWKLAALVVLLTPAILYALRGVLEAWM